MDCTASHDSAPNDPPAGSTGNGPTRWPDTNEYLSTFTNCDFCSNDGIVAHLTGKDEPISHPSSDSTGRQSGILWKGAYIFQGHKLECPFHKLVLGILSPHGDMIIEARPSLFKRGFRLIPISDVRRGYEIRVEGTTEGTVVLDHDTGLPNESEHASLLKQRFKQFIETCENEHSIQRGNFGFSPPPPEMFLVDVVERCITKASPHPRYMALSYVWGCANQFLAMKDNVEELQKSGALDRVRPLLSRVIRDAMDYVLLAGERYLWVDTLCIIQDDQEFMAKQINAMGAIYSHCLACICSTSGRSADACLPGLGADSMPLGRSRIGNRATLIATRPDLKSAIQDSVYETRAWTFQEKFLAPRLIVFTDWDTYFTCKCHSKIDGPLGEVLSMSPESFRAKTLKEQDLLFFGAYGRLIGDYTQRRNGPSRGQDRAIAVAGLSNILNRYVQAESRQGLCSKYLQLCLLFTCLCKDDLTGPFTFLPGDVIRNEGCPSWSWSGVRNPVSYGFALGLLRVSHYCDYIFQPSMPSLKLGTDESSDINPAISSIVHSPSSDTILNFQSVTARCVSFQYEPDSIWMRATECRRTFMTLEGEVCGIIYDAVLLESRANNRELELVQVARLQAPNLEGVDEYDWPCEILFEPQIPSDFLKGEHLILVLSARPTGEYLEREGCGIITETAWMPSMETGKLFA